MTKAVFFRRPSELRKWFRKHHASAAELWVGYYKKATGKPSMTWPESVQEALCFGWIDGIRKSLDEESYCNRFTPRRPRSNWSDINIKLVEKLTAEGRMTKAGLEAFAARSEAKSGVYTYEEKQKELTLDKKLERELKKNKAAWHYWEAQPPWYRRTTSRWIMSAKKEETKLRRLAALIEDSAKGRPIGPIASLKKKK
jgi:uncharacterized protein YdeI (YjbR/CyaY-like superfamily)